MDYILTMIAGITSGIVSPLVTLILAKVLKAERQAGGKVFLDRKRMGIYKECISLGKMTMFAPCNKSNLEIEKQEYFLLVAEPMVAAWDDMAKGNAISSVASIAFPALAKPDTDDDTVDLPGVIYRRKFDRGVPDSPEGQGGLDLVPYSIRSQRERDRLQDQIERCHEWLHEQAIIDEQDRKDGVYADYSDLIKAYREQDHERILRCIRTTGLPYFLQLAHEMENMSADGTGTGCSACWLMRMENMSADGTRQS